MVSWGGIDPMTLRRLVLTLIALAITVPNAVRADEPLIADLDDHLVAITAGFTGTEILVFGSIEGGGEVVVIVHGPNEDVVVRRKDRVAGIWMNQEAVTFEAVPAFYHVATTARDGLDLPASAMRRHQIGVQNLRFRPMQEDLLPETEDAFGAALIRRKIAVGHYTENAGLVERRGGRLFRASILIPTNVPVGTYTIETLLVRDGEVVGAQTTPLFVNKEGFGAQVYRAAHLYPAYYGIAAVLIAALAGFLANWAFRKI